MIIILELLPIYWIFFFFSNICSPATIARRLYIRGDVGVGAFSKVFGKKFTKTCLPGHFAPAARNIIRTSLRKLGELKLAEISPKGFVFIYYYYCCCCFDYNFVLSLSFKIFIFVMIQIHLQMISVSHPAFQTQRPPSDPGGKT